MKLRRLAGVSISCSLEVNRMEADEHRCLIKSQLLCAVTPESRSIVHPLMQARLDVGYPTSVA
jgi:hypothetical protein